MYARFGLGHLQNGRMSRTVPPDGSYIFCAGNKVQVGRVELLEKVAPQKQCHLTSKETYVQPLFAGKQR